MRTAVIFARLVRFGSPLRAREGNAKVVPKHLLPRGDAITCSLKPALPVSARPERRAACAQPPRSRLPSGARRPGRRGGDSAARVTGAGAPGPREIGWAPPYHSHASSARRAGGDHRCEAAPERWWEVPVPSAWRVSHPHPGGRGGGRWAAGAGVGRRASGCAKRQPSSMRGRPRLTISEHAHANFRAKRDFCANPACQAATTYSLWTRPLAYCRVPTCMRTMSHGTAPKSGIPAPMSTGTRVIMRR